MIIYFIMIGLASSFVGAEFVMDVQRQELRTELRHNYEKLIESKMQPDEAFHPIQQIKNKAILMVLIIFVVVIILLTMFIKNITEPLQHMIEVSKLIATGDLSQTVEIRANNELAEMGNTINDLTSNLQEMILLSKVTTTTSKRFMAKVSELLEAQQTDQSRVEDLRHEMRILSSQNKLLNEIILSCKFYGIAR